MADLAAQGSNAVNHPSHYNQGGIETMDYIDAIGLGYDFCIGNVIKYCSRAGHKQNQLEDLKKARWYLNYAIISLEGGDDCRTDD